MKNKTILLLAVGDGADDVNAPKYRAALHQFNGKICDEILCLYSDFL